MGYSHPKGDNEVVARYILDSLGIDKIGYDKFTKISMAIYRLQVIERRKCESELGLAIYKALCGEKPIEPIKFVVVTEEKNNEPS